MHRPLESELTPSHLPPARLRLPRLFRQCAAAALLFASAGWLAAASAPPAHALALPVRLDFYRDSPQAGLAETLHGRIDVVPFNLVASVIFFLAICHTFLTAKFRHWARIAEERHTAQLAQRPVSRTDSDEDACRTKSASRARSCTFSGRLKRCSASGSSC